VNPRRAVSEDWAWKRSVFSKLGLESPSARVKNEQLVSNGRCSLPEAQRGGGLEGAHPPRPGVDRRPARLFAMPHLVGDRLSLRSPWRGSLSNLRPLTMGALALAERKRSQGRQAGIRRDDCPRPEEGRGFVNSEERIALLSCVSSRAPTALGKAELNRKVGCAGWILARVPQICHFNATSSENCTSI